MRDHEAASIGKAHVFDKLRRVGLRPTRQRVALARALFEGEHRHVTAESLHAEDRRGLAKRG